MRQGSLFQNVSTAIKVVLIVAFIVAGFAFGTPQPISFAPSAQDLGYILSAPFAISLVFVMYSYSGWNAATYIINEVRDPERSLPRSLLAATLIVLVLYVALNAVFLYTTPMAKMAGQINVAQIAGAEIFGDAGGRLVAALICIGLVSAVSAMVWIGPRVTMVIGEDTSAACASLRARRRRACRLTAILFQLAVVTLLLFTQSFEAVIDYIQFSLTFCTFLAVLGVIVLRCTQPELKRPYRVWGYPLTPVVFLFVTGFMMYYLMTQRPMQSLASVLTMLAGLVVFAVSRRPLRKVEADPRRRRARRRVATAAGGGALRPPPRCARLRGVKSQPDGSPDRGGWGCLQGSAKPFPRADGDGSRRQARKGTDLPPRQLLDNQGPGGCPREGALAAAQAAFVSASSAASRRPRALLASTSVMRWTRRDRRASQPRRSRAPCGPAQPRRAGARNRIARAGSPTDRGPAPPRQWRSGRPS